jgi:hypothetical protein
MSSSPLRIAVAAPIKAKIAEATERLAAAERELTLAMEAITVPELGADNEMIGERLRTALGELGAARQALEVVLEATP